MQGSLRSRLVAIGVAKTLAIVTVTMLALTRLARADDDCTALLKSGMYDYASSVSNNVQAASFQSDFCQTYNKYKSDQVAGSAAASYGLFNGSLSFSSAQVESLGTMLCSNTATNSSMSAALTTVSSVIDGNAVNAFNNCVALNSKVDGLHVLPQTNAVDPTVIDLSVRYIGTGASPQATLQSVNFDSAKMSCAGDLVNNKSTAITSSYRGMTCTRTLYGTPQPYNVGTQTTLIYAPPATVTVSTDAGQYQETVAAIPAGPQPPSSATVPLGGIIAWYRMRATDPIPDGYWVTDGSTITDPNSPFNGMTAPNLVDHFVMGVTPARLGESGGSNVIPSQPDQSYGFSGTTSDAHGNSDGWKIDDNRGCCPQADGSGHTHTYSGSITVPGHNHGGDKRPAYVGLLYLIRVR